MSRSQRLYFLGDRISHAVLFVASALLLSLTWLAPIALAADRARQQIDPQLQRPQDIPLERLERPFRTWIDINTATVEQLVALPGMNATLAQQIVAGRPYRSKTDLVQRHILSDATYDRIKNLIAIE
jgi:predicted DNA-binding helix-hairpin-helix protein